MSRKVLYISGTRADYGLMRSALRAISDHPNLELSILATGMHLMADYGMSIDEIRADGYSLHQINAVYESDTKESMARFVGTCIVQLVDHISSIDPDVILLLGDRGEMLAGAIVGNYLSIPVAHIHGGEITSTVDDIARHAITKLSHIHFPATEKSAERIVRMGEDPSRVYVVGAPGLDQVLHAAVTEPDILAKKYGLDRKKPILLIVQHPVTLESERSGEQMRETMEAVLSLDSQNVIVYPNADAGGRKMIDVINEYAHYPQMRIFPNLPHDDFLGLMRISSALIGNSSSGIIEAPSFNLPVINIGTRQQGRERGANVIDVPYDRHEITAAAQRALFDKDFKAAVNSGKNPYGDGHSGNRIARILGEIPLDPASVQKRLSY